MSVHKETPLIQQYNAIRKEYQDALLFFQVGDFYELFFDDAKKASAFLGLALTKRGKSNGEDIPLCGIPVHALKHYLAKLVKGGFKVALCDQLSEPKPGTIVERGVTQVYSPGTLVDDHMLEQKSASYLLTLYCANDQWGLLFSELLTAQLFATSFPAESYRHLENELARFIPDEVVLPFSNNYSFLESYFKQNGFWVSLANSQVGDDKVGEEISSAHFISQFNETSRELLNTNPALRGSAHVLYSYLNKNHNQALHHFNSIQFYTPDDYVYLDATTLKTLELVKNSNDGSTKHTLFSVLDKAKTSMGSRTIKKWLTRPLLQREIIEQRQKVVAFFRSNILLMQECEEILSTISDLERIVGRIALKKASVNDYLLLKESLKALSSLRRCLNDESSKGGLMAALCSYLFDFSSLISLLERSLEEGLGSPRLIKKRFDEKLDSLRDLVENAQQKLLMLEAEEIKKTGIESLKIRFNKIMGYAIEITKANFEKIPPHYIRQQTLSNRERFVTPELIALEREIIQAHNQITPYEQSVFDSIKKEVESHLSLLRKTAYAIAYIDALYSFAVAAYEYSFTCPTFNDNRDFIIKEGRHAVVEQTMQSAFVPNDTLLTDEQSLLIITGPNMGGKSTYLRQVAHMSILAQCGSFVPAKEASLPIVDRIFTRIGSGDNLAEGKSTFLVEMEETSRICTYATASSLVILDEVGRGTSTYDGLAIAQSVIEYLHTTLRARCLFATHYHELTALHETHSAIVPYYMASQKNERGIIFLHTLVQGTAQQSFGIDVAHLAALPLPIIERAKKLVKEFEQSHRAYHQEPNQKGIESSDNLREQLTTLHHSLQRQEQIMSELQKIDLNDLSPREAFTFLWNLKSKL